MIYKIIAIIFIFAFNDSYDSDEYCVEYDFESFSIFAGYCYSNVDQFFNKNFLYIMAAH